jgi:hypothetical protein
VIEPQAVQVVRTVVLMLKLLAIWDQGVCLHLRALMSSRYWSTMGLRHSVDGRISELIGEILRDCFFIRPGWSCRKRS